MTSLKRRNPFRVTRHGEPIEDVRVRDSVDPGIQYGMSFAEWEAGVEAGVDMYKWETGGYPKWFKAKVLAWYRLHNLVKLHTEDAVQAAARHKSKH